MDYISKFISYLQATKNLSAKSLSAYKSDLTQFFDFEQDILHPDICSFIAYLSSKLNLKDTSICRKIITLKCFYSYLIDNEIIDHSPFTKLKFRFKQEHKLPKTLAIKDVSKILDYFESICFESLAYNDKKSPTEICKTFDMLLKTLKVEQSFSQRGTPYDNAVIESFFSNM